MLGSTSVSLRTAILLQLPAVCAAIVLWRRARRVVPPQAEEVTSGPVPARCTAIAEATANVSRNIPLRNASSTVVLIIDMQKFCCDLELGGCWVDHTPSDYDREALPKAVDNIAKLLGAARGAKVECIFTVIESLTADGRDRSLDYKVSGFNVPRGSRDAEVLDALKPAEDEIVLPKCSSSVFISTNLTYKLRNLGCEQL